MTHEQLAALWKQYWRENHDKNLRFGQFVFNQVGYETDKSYAEYNPFIAYAMLSESIYALSSNS